MIEYFTKRISPNNTEYRFNCARTELGNLWITVTRVRPWYQRNEIILIRRFSEQKQATDFFQGLLDSFPRDLLYKE